MPPEQIAQQTAKAETAHGRTGGKLQPAVRRPVRQVERPLRDQGVGAGPEGNTPQTGKGGRS